MTTTTLSNGFKTIDKGDPDWDVPVNANATLANTNGGKQKNRWIDQGAAKTASITLAAWYRVKYDTTSAGITQALPSGVAGDELNLSVSSGTNNLTLTGSGGPITVSPSTGATLVHTGTIWEKQPSSSVSSGGGGTTGVQPETYAAVGNGTTDDTDALQATYNAAKALAVAGTTVYIDFKPGATYLLNKSGNSGIQWDSQHAGRIVFRGNGATVKAGASTKCFLYAVSSSSGNQGGVSGTWGNVEIENLVWDNNSTQTTWGFQGRLFNFIKKPDEFTALKNVRVRRCTVKNAPRASSGNPFLIPVEISIESFNSTTLNAAASVTDIYVEDCDFGRDGTYGGNSGVVIQNIDTSGLFSWQSQIRTPGWRTNVSFDRIYLRRIYHDGGPASTTYVSDSNYLVGAQGRVGTVVCEDLIGVNSGDDGLEINSALDATVDRCEFYDANSKYGMLFTNTGGMPVPELQHIRVRACKSGAITGSNGSITTGVVFRLAPGAPHGHISIDDLHLPDGYLNVITDYQSLSIRKVTGGRSKTYTPSANGDFVTTALVTVAQIGGRAPTTIDDVTCEQIFTYDNTAAKTSTSVKMRALGLGPISDSALSVKNISMSNKLKVTGALSAASVAPVVFLDQQGTTTATMNGSDNGLWVYDGGVSTDVAVSGGVLTPAGTFTTERRAIAAQLASTDYINAVAGPFTDSCVILKRTPGSTITGSAGGVVIKAIDANNYVEAYVYDDGTNSYLCVDKVVGGTRATVLGAIVGGVGTVTSISIPPSNVSDRGVQLASRVATSTAYWIRGVIQGATVKADYYTSSVVAATGSGATTATGTITAQADLRALVTTQGFPGYKWVPMSSTDTLDDVSLVRMRAMTARFENLNVPSLDPSGSGVSVSGIDLDSSQTLNSNYRVINGSIEVASLDYLRHTTAAAATAAVSGSNIPANVFRFWDSFSFTTDTVNVVATAGSAQTIPAVSVAGSNKYTLTSASCTFTLPTAVAGQSFSVTLVQDGTGGRLATFTGAKWAGGTAPTLSTAANAIDDFVFKCDDATVGWKGFIAGLDMR